MRHPCCTFALTVCALLATAIPAVAQAYTPEQPRRRFITVSVDWLYTHPLHFEKHPLEALVGSEVALAQGQAYDYHTRDGRLLIDVLEFRRRGRGASVTIFPFGSGTRTTLALRGAVEQLPVIEMVFDGDGAPPPYSLTGARAIDVGVAIHVPDRAPGWGLGSYAFVGGGAGRIQSSLGNGDRYFAEGGGGVGAGPFGVELGVKFAFNRLSEPTEHRFWTVPVTLRGTLTF
jgi:hypothetical protein